MLKNYRKKDDKLTKAIQYDGSGKSLKECQSIVGKELKCVGDKQLIYFGVKVNKSDWFVYDPKFIREGYFVIMDNEAFKERYEEL